MIRIAEKRDIDIIANLAVLMLSNYSVNDLMEEFLEILSKGNAQFFFKMKKTLLDRSITSTFTCIMIRKPGSLSMRKKKSASQNAK